MEQNQYQFLQWLFDNLKLILKGNVTIDNTDNTISIATGTPGSGVKFDDKDVKTIVKGTDIGIEIDADGALTFSGVPTFPLFNAKNVTGIKAATNVSITQDAEGVISISATGGSGGSDITFDSKTVKTLVKGINSNAVIDDSGNLTLASSDTVVQVDGNKATSIVAGTNVTLKNTLGVVSISSSGGGSSITFKTVNITEIIPGPNSLATISSVGALTLDSKDTIIKDEKGVDILTLKGSSSVTISNPDGTAILTAPDAISFNSGTGTGEGVHVISNGVNSTAIITSNNLVLSSSISVNGVAYEKVQFSPTEFIVTGTAGGTANISNVTATDLFTYSIKPVEVSRVSAQLGSGDFWEVSTSYWQNFFQTIDESINTEAEFDLWLSQNYAAYDFYVLIVDNKGNFLYEKVNGFGHLDNGLSRTSFNSQIANGTTVDVPNYYQYRTEMSWTSGAKMYLTDHNNTFEKVSVFKSVTIIAFRSTYQQAILSDRLNKKSIKEDVNGLIYSIADRFNGMTVTNGKGLQPVVICAFTSATAITPDTLISVDFWKTSQGHLTLRYDNANGHRDSIKISELNDLAYFAFDNDNPDSIGTNGKPLNLPLLSFAIAKPGDVLGRTTLTNALMVIADLSVINEVSFEKFKGTINGEVVSDKDVVWGDNNTEIISNIIEAKEFPFFFTYAIDTLYTPIVQSTTYMARNAFNNIGKFTLPIDLQGTPLNNVATLNIKDGQHMRVLGGNFYVDRWFIGAGDTHMSLTSAIPFISVGGVKQDLFIVKNGEYTAQYNWNLLNKYLKFNSTTGQYQMWSEGDTLYIGSSNKKPSIKITQTDSECGLIDNEGVVHPFIGGGGGSNPNFNPDGTAKQDVDMNNFAFKNVKSVALEGTTAMAITTNKIDYVNEINYGANNAIQSIKIGNSVAIDDQTLAVKGGIETIVLVSEIGMGINTDFSKTLSNQLSTAVTVNISRSTDTGIPYYAWITSSWDTSTIVTGTAIAGVDNSGIPANAFVTRVPIITGNVFDWAHALMGHTGTTVNSFKQFSTGSTTNPTYNNTTLDVINNINGPANLFKDGALTLPSGGSGSSPFDSSGNLTKNIFLNTSSFTASSTVNYGINFANGIFKIGDLNASQGNKIYMTVIDGSAIYKDDQGIDHNLINISTNAQLETEKKRVKTLTGKVTTLEAEMTAMKLQISNLNLKAIASNTNELDVIVPRVEVLENEVKDITTLDLKSIPEIRSIANSNKATGSKNYNGIQDLNTQMAYVMKKIGG